MITEDYVSFENAKLLKERGFDEDINLWYDENGEMFSRHKYDINSDWRVKMQQKVYLCPTLQMTIKWLREIHNILILINCDRDIFNDYPLYFAEFQFLNDEPKQYVIDNCIECYKYEDCFERAIKYCLENLI